MTEFKHTPGPWVLSPAHHETLVRAVDPRNGRRVASTFMPASAASIAENEANARLIAAAPEMVELLAWLVGPYGPVGPEWSADKRIIQGRRILAKIKGE